MAGEKIKIHNRLLLLFWNLFITASFCFSQNQNGKTNYHLQVLTRILSDTDFANKFNDLKSRDLESKLIVVVPENYMFYANRINDFNMQIVSDKQAACNYLNNNDRKLVIVMSAIEVIDSVDKFLIPVSYYEVHKIKRKCNWKVYLGGSLLNSDEYPYTFVFNNSLNVWEINKVNK